MCVYIYIYTYIYSSLWRPVEEEIWDLKHNSEILNKIEQLLHCKRSSTTPWFKFSRSVCLFIYIHTYIALSGPAEEERDLETCRRCPLSCWRGRNKRQRHGPLFVCVPLPLPTATTTAPQVFYYSLSCKENGGGWLVANYFL